MIGAGAPADDWLSPSGASGAPDAGDWVTPPTDQSNPDWKNLAAGFGQGVTSTAGSLLDALNPVRFVKRQAYDLSQMASGKPIAPPTPTAAPILNEALGTVGLNPDEVPARTLTDRLEQGAGAGASAVLFPAGEFTFGRALGNAFVGAGYGLGSTAAQELAPPGLKPAVGALAGTGAALLTGSVLPRAAGAAASATRPFAASAMPSAAERVASDTMAGRATDAEATLDKLASGPTQVVTGSQPTTFQQTGDMGLGSLERETATANPDLFKTRAGEQNAARVGAMTELSPDANVGDFSGFLNSQLRDLDATTAAHVENLTNKAQAAVEAMGDAATPEVHGAALRGVLQSAETAARARESGLWKAVDPSGTLTGNTVETSAAANNIVSGISPTAKPLSGEEAGIFQAAQAMPPLSPVSDLIALRSRVSTEMRNELITNGRSPSYARLAQLRGAIQSNLANSIGQELSNQQSAVASGALSPDDTVASRIQQWQDQFYANRNAQQAGTVGAESTVAPAAGGTTEAVGSDGTALPPSGGPGSAPGNQGLPSNAPTFDAAAADRLAAATAATRQRAQAFGVPPIQSVLAKAGTQDIYRLPDSSVAGKYFHPGPKGYDDMLTLYPGANKAEVLPIIRDYAAMTLRRAALKDDGTLDPAAFSRWQAKYADSLRALPPEMQQAFSDAGSASQAVADATALHANAVKQAQTGAVGQIMGAQTPEDVTRIVGSLFGSKTAAGQFQELARLTAKNPDAQAGLKQAVVDHMMNKFISNTEAGASDVNAIKADQFQTFLKNNQAPLSSVFKPDEMASLNAIASDLRQSARSTSAVKLPGQSNTPQDIYGMMKNMQYNPTALRLLVDLSTAAGAAATGHGWFAAIAGALGAHAVQAIRGAGINNASQLVTRAMLDPALAKALLQKAVLRGQPTWSASIGRALRQSVPAAFAAQNQGEQ